MQQTAFQQSKEADIPVAIMATADDGVGVVPLAYAEQQPPSLLQKGLNARVFVPPQSLSNSKILGDVEIHALKAQGYTSGLIRGITNNICQTFPLRIWVVDNSGSMSMGDGHRIVETTDKTKQVKLVQCSRWTELQETVEYHARMAALLQAPTVFRLLNDPGRRVGPQQFSIAEQRQTTGADGIAEELQTAITTMQRASPSGCTPLAEHVREIRANLLAMLPALTETGQKVAVVLATDGLPTDAFGVSSGATRAEFETSLRSLEALPVWIVVRLCTDEDSVVEYYNNLDNQLELSLEVLDDFTGEAVEVCQHNPWLTYSLCLHRIREMGFHHRLFDLLDERRLTLDEVREFVSLLFDDDLDGHRLPDPQVDWKGFLDQVGILVHREKKQWNPVAKKMTYWIDMKKLKRVYADGCCIM
jgi:hypothetical protein